MAYTDFTLDSTETTLGVISQSGDLFPNLTPVPIPTWLQDLLARGQALAFVSEKSRSEFVVAPVLLAVREMSGNAVAVYSGQRLDVDASRGLQGECDFLLAITEPLPRLRGPLLALVEAKKNDIEAGLGQCVAQMVAAQLFNERAGVSGHSVFGCVTTGETWQFLRLDDKRVIIDQRRHYINLLGEVLAVFRAILQIGGMTIV